MLSFRVPLIVDAKPVFELVFGCAELIVQLAELVLVAAVILLGKRSRPVFHLELAVERVDFCLLYTSRCV